MSGRVPGTGLLLGAAILALTSGGLALTGHRGIAREQAEEAAEARAVGLFDDMHVHLESWAAEAASTYEEITRLPERKRGAFRHEGRAWMLIEDHLRSLPPEHGARVAFYGERPEAGGLSVLGWADASGVTRDAPADWSGRAPAVITRRLLKRFEQQIDARGFGWFSREGDGPVRINLLLPVAHEYDPPEDDEDADVIVVFRLIHVSSVWPSTAQQQMTVRLDVVDGEVDATLPRAMTEAGDVLGAGAISGRCIYPELWPLDFPVPDPAARVAWRAPGAGLSMLPLWLAALALGLLLAGGLLLWRGRAEPAADGAPPDVTAEAAHEMRTPLTAMRGEIEVTLRRDRSSEDYRQALVSCLDEVKGLQGILNNVLLLSRGAFTAPAREAVDLAAVVGAEVDRLRVTSAERDVTIDAPAADGMVMGDPSLLARACGNLLDNAAAHSTAGRPIHVVVRIGRRTVEVSVTDDGPGIPRARQGQIFERFYRGPEVGQRGIPGSGLGLPISRWIAELHGGTLTIDPSLVASTRFVLRMPRA